MPEQNKDKGTAPLMQELKKPETKTQPQLQKVLPTLETALGLEDSSILDLSVQKPFVVVYIRPFGEELGEILKKGESRISYIFKGVTPDKLKVKFFKILGGIKPENYRVIKEEIFEYEYPISIRETIYNSAKNLNETH